MSVTLINYCGCRYFSNPFILFKNIDFRFLRKNQAFSNAGLMVSPSTSHVEHLRDTLADTYLGFLFAVFHTKPKDLCACGLIPESDCLSLSVWHQSGGRLPHHLSQILCIQMNMWVQRAETLSKDRQQVESRNQRGMLPCWFSWTEETSQISCWARTVSPRVPQSNFPQVLWTSLASKWWMVTGLESKLSPESYGLTPTWIL